MTKRRLQAAGLAFAVLAAYSAGVLARELRL